MMAVSLKAARADRVRATGVKGLGMRIAYLDCFSGISGDMFLGALVDAGVPAALLEETVRGLNLGARLEISRVDRSGIGATKVDVIVHGEKDLPREEYWEKRGWQEREIEKRHEHLTGHQHEQAHPHRHDATEQGAVAVQGAQAGAPVPHEHGRGLKEIREIIGRAAIGAGAKQRALAIFEALGAAEAKIHQTDIEKIHFHEVGAVDALVDIIGAAVMSEALGVDEWVFSPLNVGSGTVKCAHGTFPVPAPATLELLKDAPVYSNGLQVELVTPTGAAIARSLATRFATFPALKVERIGYGAGSRNFERHANVLRITVGDVASHVSAGGLAGDAAQEVIEVIEANLDDATPQVIGYCMERLLAEGALDVFCTPVQMKKSRPGALLTALVRPSETARAVEMIFAESTTIGVRVRQERRVVLERRSAVVRTEWGEVRIKVAGGGVNAQPEYEDCRAIAEKHAVPLKRVMAEAMRAWMER